uniref:ubiquitinyl hydrolase 1 n=1 Tax=Strigamia maritima TaxID=126957 RepID=T1IKX5_STRMM
MATRKKFCCTLHVRQMEIDEESVVTLLSMGFPDECEVRRALRIAKNDLNEAVAVLTNDQSSQNYLMDVNEAEVEMANSKNKEIVSSVPPSYEEVVESEKNGGNKPESPVEFPVANLYELESRVFVESWSIPYKREESLGKCLLATIRLSKEGLCNADENCKRFVERCMPEAFKKLLTSAAVRRWGPEIQEGIYSMLELLVDVVVERLKCGPIPEMLLFNTFSLALDPECEWHIKNKSRRWSLLHWEEVFGQGQYYASSPPASFFKDSNGWLVDLINRFAERGGFQHVQAKFDEDIQDTAMCSLLKPFGLCAEYFNSSVVCPILSPCMDKAVIYIQSLQNCDLKRKKVSAITELLSAMKLLCVHLWPNKVEMMNNLRLEIILRMLKSSHFNSRMNALKEVTKLIDEATSVKANKVALDSDALLEWIAESNEILIMFNTPIGHRLSLEELTKIWKMQVLYFVIDQNNQVVDNIYAIMAAASAKFNAQQFDHLFTLIQKNWQEENVGMREKLLTLIGKIEKRDQENVLDLLWDLAHLPSLPTHLIEQSLEEHMSILNDPAFKDQVKKNYVNKCVEDIKKGCCVLPAIKQLNNIAHSIAKPSIHKQDKAALTDLNKTHEVVKLITSSLNKCHKLSLSVVGEGKLGPDVIIDNRYTHCEFVNCHLNFLQFMLQEGDLYLTWSRCKDIWDSLVSNPDACEFCFDWFSNCLEDLETDTRSQLFQQKLLKMDPAQVTMRAFQCFKTYFESVNIEERKLKKVPNYVVVDRLDPIGIDFFWQLVLYAQNEEIADIAIDNILDLSYLLLAPRLKKDPEVLHKKFISDCSKRLETSMMTLSGSAMSTAVSSATKTLTAMSVAEVASLPLPSRSVQLQNIRRLLMIAERYVSTIEENHSAPRTILPHGAAFQGHPISMHVVICEGTKQEFTIISHSNEPLRSLRQNIAHQMKLTPEHIQIAANDKILVPSKDPKLLGQLEFADEQNIVVKINGSGNAATMNPNQNVQIQEPCSDEVDSNSAGNSASNSMASAASSTGSNRQSFIFEQEKMLPGVVMASGGQVFEMLYRLTELEDSKITSCVRNLLRLIPTDQSIQDALDSLGTKEIPRLNPSSEASPRASPRSSPKKLNVSRDKESSWEGLKVFFDAHAMSPFRVLYNLEVLSSKLMPTSNDLGTQHSALMFCEEFLSVGGLRLVINILQKDAMPTEVDYDTRQGCYFIALQLARFLLCGQTITGTADMPPSPQIKIKKPTLDAVNPTYFPLAATKAIQTMGVAEFSDTVLCFMRVAWAAAAGRLSLANSTYTTRESSTYFIGCGGRSRQSSTGSNASSSSEGEIHTLHAGVCSQQSHVMPRDSLIAREALELLVTCLQLRKHNLGSFYNLTCVTDFIIDTVLGSPNIEIRNKACEQFYRLSQISSFQEGVLSPHHFLLQTLLKAHLPLWVSSSSTRGTIEDQQNLQINPVQMMDDEIAWLLNFTTSVNISTQPSDNALLAGHLRLIQTLLTCEGVDKKHFGGLIICDLLNQFLFPASWVICERLHSNSTDITPNFSPKCSGIEARIAGYDLLQELATNCPQNMKQIASQLIHLHHSFNSDLAKEYEYEPAVISRASCGYVGLKNAGATCYMNSVIQQLFLVPGVREAILSVDDENAKEDSVFCQFQSVFGHLLDSQLQYYVPANFWKCFKLWGQPVNVREQQDAFEFFMHLIDQVDEYLKQNKRPQIFKNSFEGLFSNQMICQDCPHRYEREESFMALNVTVKSHNLQESLDQFVKGELLDGDNAYFCEKCSEKRNTIKRTCIKKLSLVLVIHLKRFDYDWEANRALKFDDHFKFPWTLDMSPYMAEGIQEKEKANKLDSTNVDNSNIHIKTSSKSHETLYELVGIVVHSGQANAGHYYSYIKDRRGDSATNSNRGKWFKFNDTSVEEFDMNDMTLEAECFASSYPEIRQRYWNGYMLFYERMEDATKIPRTPRRSTNRRSFMKPEEQKIANSLSAVRKDSDGLTQLTELVHHGDRQGIFQDRMPARIQQMVHEENLHFMQNRDVYCEEYFSFVYQLVICNMNANNRSVCSTTSAELAISFLLNTYFRTKNKEIGVIDIWSNTLASLLDQSQETTFWMLEYFAGEAGMAYIKSFLLECPNKDVRNAFGDMLKTLLESYFKCNLGTPNKHTDDLIEYFLVLLNKEVPDNCRTCSQYFELLFACTQMGRKACAHLFQHAAFTRLLSFLLGPANMNAKSDEVLSKRWSAFQAREFAGLHTTLASLILICDVTPYRTCAQDNSADKSPATKSSALLPMPSDIHAALFGPRGHWYIREVIIACREVFDCLAAIVDMLIHCSFCNLSFTNLVLQHIVLQYVTVPSNELKNIFQVLLEMLVIEDPLQFTRLQYIIDGCIDKSSTPSDGMLAIIKLNHASDSRRSYQCIKFLVHLANKSSLAKDYLMQSPTRWQWAVNWLRKKMTEHNYWNQQSIPLSNEDSNSHSFQRTISAQDTLAEATALLSEVDPPDCEMETDNFEDEEEKSKEKAVAINWKV